MEKRDAIIKVMSPGGIVSDGCRGKAHESMINFLYVEGVTGTCLYWKTVDMGSRTKDGAELAKEVQSVKEEMEGVAGPGKVRTYTTDRASANKVSWQILKEHGLEGGPDSVHVHHSMIGDVLATIPGFSESAEQAKAGPSPKEEAPPRGPRGAHTSGWFVS